MILALYKLRCQCSWLVMASLKMFVRRRSSAVDQYMAKMKSSSSGKAGETTTLRTSLHSRRVELNKQIEMEDRIADGTRKLLGVTSDTHSRNQAALEMNFSESKIKALQSELAKINSSLSAYQAKGCETTQVPLIPLAFKATHKINFETSFKEICRTHYHTPPVVIEEAVHSFQQLRDSVSSVPRTQDGVQLLLEYNSHLQLVSKRFIHSKLKHGVCFTWYDAINGLPYQQQTTVFERACVLFNVAALYSQLAANVDRSCNVSSAVELLSKSAGMFEYVRDKFSNAPSPDLSSDMLSMLADLMRSQAQELVCESCDQDEGHIDRAHQAKCVANCYAPVREFMERSEVKEYLPECWVTLVKVKEAHYTGLAHYHAAKAHQAVTLLLNNGGSIPEELRTELHFLYIESPSELNSNQSTAHTGLMQAHLSSATIHHEFALKYLSVCRDLHHVTSLTKVLSEAAVTTATLREQVSSLSADSITLPAIQASGLSVHSISPSPSAVKVTDLFAVLGPLSSFNAINSWSPPRTIKLSTQSTLGMCIGKSHPVIITRIEPGGSAQAEGVLAGDWLLSVCGVRVVESSHEEVVELLTTLPSHNNNLTLEITTPTIL